MAHEQGPLEHGGVRAGTAEGRWIIAAAVLGSGVVFLDGTVVNVALPSIGDDLGVSLSGLQWIANAYLVTLSALLLLGGSLGDRFGRRRTFVVGLAWFSVASALCAVAPDERLLVAARALQGVGGALLVPGSLSLIATAFHDEDRAVAIGAWSGLAGVTSSLGPFVGGWLIDSVSWRFIFVVNGPLALAAALIALRHIPESRTASANGLDLPGALLVTVALAGIAYAAIERSGTTSVAAGLVGVGALAGFLGVQRRTSHPMLPLGLFRSRQFSGANITTFTVYGGLGVAFFLLVLRLQTTLGYSALAAGASLVPFTVLTLLLSARAGRVAQRIGARPLMVVGPVVAGLGMFVLGEVSAGDRYLGAVLPGVVLFGVGMAVTIAPLTAAVFAAVDDDLAGVASGVNNAVSRVAGLLAVAVVPALAGVAGAGSVAAGLDAGYATAMRIAGGLALLGGAVSFALVRDTAAVCSVPRGTLEQPCLEPCLAQADAEGEDAAAA